MASERSHIKQLLKQHQYDEAFYFCDQIRLHPGYRWNLRVYASRCIAKMFYEGNLDQFLPKTQYIEWMRAHYAYICGSVPVPCVWVPLVPLAPYVFFAPPAPRQIPLQNQVKNNDDNQVKINLPKKSPKNSS